MLTNKKENPDKYQNFLCSVLSGLKSGVSHPIKMLHGSLCGPSPIWSPVPTNITQRNAPKKSPPGFASGENQAQTAARRQIIPPMVIILYFPLVPAM